MSDGPVRDKSSPVRTLITLLMDFLVVVAVVLVAHMVIVFFGQLAGQAWAKGIVALTSKAVIPFGVASIKTPYRGVFDVNAAGTVFVLLGIEWVLGGVRRTV